METKARMTLKEATSVIFARKAFANAIDALPDERTVVKAGMDTRKWFEALISLQDQYDTANAKLVADSPCVECKGKGGWVDNGPHDGCSEFAEGQTIICKNCKGLGWKY